MELIPKDYGSYTPEERRKFIAKLAQQSIQQDSPKFRVKRFYLTEARRRTMVGMNSHEFGAIIKSFWVCDWSGNFKAKIVPNHKYDRDEYSGLPLRKNMAQDLEIPVADACLEFDAQPGVWIEIAYSDVENIKVGNIELSISGKSSIDEGSSYVFTKVNVVGGVVTEIVPVNQNRKITSVQAKQDCTFYIGNPADLSNVDYMNICHEVELLKGESLKIRNNGSLSIKSASSLVFSRMDEV